MTQKAQNNTQKQFFKQLQNNKARIEEERVKTLEAARRAQRKATEYKFESSKPRVIKMSPNARSRMFARLGLK